MSRLVDYADELVTSIGPRPAGSNGEHESSELIAVHLENIGMDTWLQDFSTPRDTNWIKILYYMLGVIAAELFFILPTLRILACILAVLAVILFFLDLLGFGPLFRLLSKGSSQNVIARYVPESADQRRKVVLVAHYDAGKILIQGAPSLAPFFPLILKSIRVCLVVLLLLIVLSFFPLPDIVLRLLSVIGLIIGILLFVMALIEAINLFMPYSYGANCNASGVAAIMGVAEALMGARRANRDLRESRKAYDQEASMYGTVTAREQSSRGGALARVSGAAGERASIAGTADMGRNISSAARAAAAQASTLGSPIFQTPGLPGIRAENVRPEQSRIRRGATDNPAIRVRETLTEKEEQERALQDKIDEINRKTKDGVPTWFADAKKAAQKDVEKNIVTKEGSQVSRSRFADEPIVPVTRSELGAVRRSRLSEPLPATPDLQKKQKPFAATTASSEALTLSEQSAMDEQLAVAVRVATGAVVGVAESSNFEDGHAIANWAAPPYTQPDLEQKSIPLRETPSTLNADFSGIDRLSSDPMPVPLRARLPKSASSLERAVAAPTPIIPAHDNLRNLPKMAFQNSGSIPTQQAAFNQQVLFDVDEQPLGTRRVSTTGSFAPLGATGIMKPVGEELLQYSDSEQDIYIDDADVSASWNTRESTGDNAPRMMDIPSSRTRSFFGSLGDRLSGSRKKETHATSASTWLGVEKDFDARSVGSHIGGWENFSEAEDDTWKGGAYGGNSPAENRQALSSFSSVLLDKEVWIVAVGAHESRNTGMRELLAEYERDLKSALIINLDGVGAGNLYYTMAEGSFRPKGTDHRLQGLIQSAADSLGIKIAPAGFTCYDTDAAEALDTGYRAISVVGLDNKVPAGWRWSSDRLEILDENNLQAVVDVVIEVIKSA